MISKKRFYWACLLCWFSGSLLDTGFYLFEREFLHQSVDIGINMKPVNIVLLIIFGILLALIGVFVRPWWDKDNKKD